MPIIQTKKGILFGCRGAVILPLDAQGNPIVGAEEYWIDVPQEIGIKMLIEQGEEDVTKVDGGGVIAFEEEDDTLLGVDLELKNARLDLPAQDIMLKGNLITQSIESGADVIGWRSPTLGTQITQQKFFRLQLFVRHFNGTGQQEGYIRFTFPFCRAIPGDIGVAQGKFVDLSYTIKARNHPGGSDGPYNTEFVNSLPASAG